jgi:hypothetical protein
MKKLILFFIVALIGIPLRSQTVEDDNRYFSPINISIWELQGSSNTDIMNKIVSDLMNNKEQDSITLFHDDKYPVEVFYPMYIDDAPFTMFCPTIKNLIQNNSTLSLVSDSLGPYNSLSKYEEIVEDIKSLPGNIKSYTNADNRRAIFYFPFEQGRVLKMCINTNLCLEISLDSYSKSAKEIKDYNYADDHQLNSGKDVKKYVDSINAYFKEEAHNMLNAK